MENTPGRKFYQEQLDDILKKDVDGLIDNHYNADAVLIRHDSTIRGREALKEFFRNYVELLGDLRIKSTDKFTEAEDTLFFEASVSSKLGDVRVYDALVLRGGKISYHFSGVM